MPPTGRARALGLGGLPAPRLRALAGDPRAEVLDPGQSARARVVGGRDGPRGDGASRAVLARCVDLEELGHELAPDLRGVPRIGAQPLERRELVLPLATLGPRVLEGGDALGDRAAVLVEAREAALVVGEARADVRLQPLVELEGLRGPRPPPRRRGPRRGGA